ncbi:MAG: thiamine-phosphate kinase [Rhizobiales bacterium]|nr:thiamine-phosphate kinase [Hyphomicrobiales bacterium]NRB12816.1 thiamine-phosphate kinase [Hyphomicrobiales bacterium]
MLEKDIIAKYFSPLSANAFGADNLNDDVAVLGNIGNGLLAINMDTLVAGTHFFANDDPTILAQKCLRVNISDLAAKGAVPFGYFLSVALPRKTTESFIESFAQGLAIDQRNFNISLLGGDTVKTAGPFTVTITILGLLQDSRVPRRGDAKLGDDIYVSGTIGDGALGLLSHPEYRGNNGISAKYSRHLSHYLCPEPRVELQPIISRYANATMDISDGLLGDLTEILKRSEMGAKLDINRIPYSQETQYILANEKNILPQILNGGDDYEVLFTAKPEHSLSIEKLSQNLPFCLTKIGTITDGRSLEIIDEHTNLNIEQFNLSHSHSW